MLELTRLYASLCFSPGKPLRVRSRHRVLAIGERPDHIPFTSCVEGGVEHARSLDEISWSDILKRRIRVINRPSRSELKRPEQKKKARGLKFLLLSLKKAGALCRFQEAVFGSELSQENKKLIFLPDKAGKDIFAWHFPDWHVFEFKDDSGWLEDRLFLWRHGGTKRNSGICQKASRFL